MKFIVPLVLCVALGSSQAFAELAVATKVPPPPAIPTGAHASLPEKHEYQKQLRAFMATLKEADFLPEYKDLTVAPPDKSADADTKFRAWLFSLSPPSVGYKRNYSSVMVHPTNFTVPIIEGEKAILRPPAHADALVDLANWNYAGNPYYNSRPLRLRAIVLCALDMVMLDELIEAGEEKDRPNQDQLAGQVARLAYVYPSVREAMPEPVRNAYLAGLKKHTRRLLDNAPKVLPRSLGMHTTALPALALASRVLNDADITREADAYAKTLFTDPRFFRAAGYFPLGGTLDSFNGIAMHYALWGALDGNWPFAREAIARAARLRAHLTLPDPDGTLIGPSHFSSLTSPDPANDQWNTAPRTWAMALLSDEAACLTKFPDESAVERGPESAVATVNGAIHEMSWAPGGLDPAPWRLVPIGMHGSYIYLNLPKGYYARRAALEKSGDIARLPVLRNADFLQRFGDEFLVAKKQNFAAIVHTGPVTNPDDANAGYGFGGGALSAFWTREAGSVILGRGVGAWSPQYKTLRDNWRSLPTHAVTGITADGVVFTSAHIVKPDARIATRGSEFGVEIEGTIPPARFNNDKPLVGTLVYTRRIVSWPTGVDVKTTVKGDGKVSAAELYETLPVYLRELSKQASTAPTTIEFRVDGKWSPATDAVTANVSVVRLKRFDGVVEVRFDKPSRVKLAPEWGDTYMSRVTCRNLLIDLRENEGPPSPINGERTISYRIEAVAK